MAVSRSMAQCFMVATAVTAWGKKNHSSAVWCLVKFIEQKMSKFNTMCVYMKSEGTVVVWRSTFLFSGGGGYQTQQVGFRSASFQ